MSKGSDWGIGKSSKKSHILYNLIYTATDNCLSEEDEELNKKIYSEILRNTDSPKLAAKIINKIINKSLSGHCFQSIWYCLLLLDGAVKSTDSRFVALILTKEFLSDLVKIIDPRFGVPDFVQEKLMYILKDWHTSLTNVTGYSNLVKCYKSAQYPSNAVPRQNDMSKHAKFIMPMATVSNFIAPQQVLSVENISYKNKLMQDIDIIETNLTVFSDVLSSLSPEIASTEEMQFLEELYQTGLKMQKRIDEIIPYINWEDVTNLLIQVNDKILNTNDRYKRFLSTKSQFVLTHKPKVTPKLYEVYDETNFKNNLNYKPALTEIYDSPQGNQSQNRSVLDSFAIGSLPTYKEAVTAQAKNKILEEGNLINFDEDEPMSPNYRNIPLPDIPSVGEYPQNSVTNNESSTSGLSSNEFDEFIEVIAKRQQHPVNPLDEIYAPPLYDEATLKHQKS